MASIWRQLRGQAEQKLAGHLSGNEAQRRLRHLWQEWDSRPGCHVTEGADGYMQLREGDAVCGIAWVEWCSPPSAPEPGQPLRRRTA
jgi:hypothetical protein